MDITLKVLPFEEQDKLSEELLKVQGGNYIPINYKIKLTVDGMAYPIRCSPVQDKLGEGLIRALTIGSYHPISSIIKISQPK